MSILQSFHFEKCYDVIWGPILTSTAVASVLSDIVSLNTDTYIPKGTIRLCNLFNFYVILVAALDSWKFSCH